METSEGVAHLQAAAKEMVSAARSFLDAFEEVVNDDARMQRAVSGVTDLLHQATRAVTKLSDTPESTDEPRVRRIVVD